MEKFKVKAMYSNVIVEVRENDYKKNANKAGLIIPNNTLYLSQETGQLEKDLEQIVVFAEVVEAGPDCKYLKPGMHVYLDRRGLRPIPFLGKGWEQVNEANVLCYVEAVE